MIDKDLTKSGPFVAVPVQGDEFQTGASGAATAPSSVTALMDRWGGSEIPAESRGIVAVGWTWLDNLTCLGLTTKTVRILLKTSDDPNPLVTRLRPARTDPPPTRLLFGESDEVPAPTAAQRSSDRASRRQGKRRPAPGVRLVGRLVPPQHTTSTCGSPNRIPLQGPGAIMGKLMKIIFCRCRDSIQNCNITFGYLEPCKHTNKNTVSEGSL